MTTPAIERIFRCTNIAEGGPGFVAINLVQERSEEEVNVAGFNGTFTLHLSLEEGQHYFPGQRYNVTLAPLT